MTFLINGRYAQGIGLPDNSPQLYTQQLKNSEAQHAATLSGLLFTTIKRVTAMNIRSFAMAQVQQRIVVMCQSRFISQPYGTEQAVRLLYGGLFLLFVSRSAAKEVSA